jgi:hypothetical protein
MRRYPNAPHRRRLLHALKHRYSLDPFILTNPFEGDDDDDGAASDDALLCGPDDRPTSGGT